MSAAPALELRRRRNSPGPVPAARSEERLDRVVAHVRARRHRVGKRRLAVPRLEECLRVGTRRRADVAAFHVEQDQKPGGARVVAYVLERSEAVGAERLEVRRLRFDRDDVGTDRIDDPLAEARDRGCRRGSTEHGLATELHREQVEPRVETDRELAPLAGDRLGEPVGEVDGNHRRQG